MSKKESNNKNSDIENRDESAYDLEEISYDGKDFSDFDESDSTDSLIKKLKKIKEELAECKKEKQEYLDGWQRIKADFVNLKKRNEEDRKSFAKYANEEFILELLPALDSFDQAFKNKEAWEKADKNWRTGIEFIHSQMMSILNNHGVTEMNPIGEKFDPKLHHSVEVIGVEDKKDDGKIIDVTQKGYALGDKIIRHASVKVGEVEV